MSGLRTIPLTMSGLRTIPLTLSLSKGHPEFYPSKDRNQPATRQERAV